MKTSVSKRILLIGISLLLCFSLVSCKVNKLTPDSLSVTPVGTVGGYEVTYDELYFLAKSYYTEGMSEDELKELVYNNIRTHYEQHRQDVTENYEKRLADKREIIDQLKKEILSTRILAWLCVAVLVALLIAEVMNPNLGWLRF